MTTANGGGLPPDRRSSTGCSPITMTSAARVHGTRPLRRPHWEPAPPPLIQNAADLRAANDGSSRAAAPEQYTQTQLARIQSERQALATQNARNEQMIIPAARN